MGEVGLGFPHLASCWLPVQAAWARGESEIPRKKTCVHPDCPQENSVSLKGPGCPLLGRP